jgi:hypothetical protein
MGGGAYKVVDEEEDWFSIEQVHSKAQPGDMLLVSKDGCSVMILGNTER